MAATKMGRMTEDDKIEALVDYGKSMLVVGLNGEYAVKKDENKAKRLAARVFRGLTGRQPTAAELSDLVVE